MVCLFAAPRSFKWLTTPGPRMSPEIQILIFDPIPVALRAPLLLGSCWHRVVLTLSWRQLTSCPALLRVLIL